MKTLGAKSQLLRLTLQMLMEEHEIPRVLRRDDGSYVAANGFTNFAKFALRLSVREADRLLLSMPDCTALSVVVEMEPSEPHVVDESDGVATNYVPRNPRDCTELWRDGIWIQ